MRVFIWREAAYPNYLRALSQAGGEVVSEPSAEAECDALVLSGGGDIDPRRYGQSNTASRGIDPRRDEAELALLRRFLGRPVLGICRGMQVINVFFGGTLIQDLSGHEAVEGADRWHTVQTAQGGLPGLAGGELVVNSAHHQAVDRLGRGLEAVQWAQDGVVEALRHRALPVWAVQWHPERMEGEAGQRLLAAFLRREGIKRG